MVILVVVVEKSQSDQQLGWYRRHYRCTTVGSGVVGSLFAAHLV